MKRRTLVVLITVICSFAAGAQKLGHVDGQKLLEAMPEMSEIRTKLEAQATEYKNYLEEERKKYEAMYQEYLKNAETWPEAIRRSKEEKIAAQENAMAQFEQTANQEMAAKQEELLKPVLERAKSAIEQVGKENNYTYVFDSSQGALLYMGGDDLMAQVKAKLGIK